MENRSKWSKMTDSNLKAMGKGERTSKKVSTIRKADGTSFRRKNANQYGAAEGGNDYTEKRVNRTDRFGTGGTADSAENGGANIGGTLGSSMMKNGGGVGTIKERVIDYYINNSDNEDLINLMGVSDVPNLKQVAEKWVNNRDSYYDKIFSAIDGIHNRTWAENKFEELGLQKLANGGGLADVPESFPETDAMSYKTGGGVGDESYWKNMPKNAAKNLAEYYGNKKLAFNKKELNLSKKDLAELKEVQMMINKYHPEFNHYLSLMHKEYKMEMGGSTKGFEYSIGGL